METVEKKTYEPPEIQVIELEQQMLLNPGSPNKKYVPEFIDDLG